MGRDYIGERAIVDPVMRAARKRAKAAKAKAERDSMAAYVQRSKVCRIKGCGKPTTPEWVFCCSESHWNEWLALADRKEEGAQARRLGIPVAEYRKGKAKAVANTD